MKRYLFLLSLLCLSIVSNAQSNAGFAAGDAELNKLIERGIMKFMHDDTLHYSFFTTAFLEFDQAGNLDTVQFMNDQQTWFNQQLGKFLMQTKSMWRSENAKDQLVIIPVEVRKMDKNDEYIPAINQQAFSKEFLSLFRSKVSFKATFLRPIVITSYARMT